MKFGKTLIFAAASLLSLVACSATFGSTVHSDSEAKGKLEKAGYTVQKYNGEEYNSTPRGQVITLDASMGLKTYLLGLKDESVTAEIYVFGSLSQSEKWFDSVMTTSAFSECKTKAMVDNLVIFGVAENLKAALGY